MASKSTTSLATLSAASAIALHNYQRTRRPISLGATTIVGIFIFLVLKSIWKFYLYPFYFSPLRKFPRAPHVNGAKGFVKPISPDQALKFMETIPNDGIIRHLDIFNSEVLILTQPRLIVDVFQTKNDDYIRPPWITRIMDNLVGNGLLCAEGVVHKYQRKHLLPAFHSRVIKNLYPLFWTKASEMVSVIKNQIQANSLTTASQPLTTVNIDDLGGRVALDIIGQAGFGIEFSSLSDPNSFLNKSYRIAFLPNANSRLYFILAMMTRPWLVNLIPSKVNKKIRKGLLSVTDYIHEVVAEKQQKEQSEDVEQQDVKGSQKDIIASAIRTRAFSTEELVHQSKNLLGAGHETSSSALTWGMYALSLKRNAHIQSRLRDEIRSNLPSPDSGIEIDEAMLERLPYLDAVSKEILRLYSPAPTFGRVSTRDTDICGQRIPKGTYVRAQPWALGKLKSLWGEDAMEFKPDRWLVGKNKDIGGATEALAFSTFGYGPRSCIGRGFAIGENKALIAALVGSFEITPSGQEKDLKDLDILFQITTKIAGGLNVEMKVIEGW